jgi:hypothetical protein
VNNYWLLTSNTYYSNTLVLILTTHNQNSKELMNKLHKLRNLSNINNAIKASLNAWSIFIFGFSCYNLMNSLSSKGLMVSGF